MTRTQETIRIGDATLGVAVTAFVPAGLVWMAFLGVFGDTFPEALFVPVAVALAILAAGVVGWLSWRTRVVLSDGAIVIHNPLSSRSIELDGRWSAEWVDSPAYAVWRFRGRRLALSSLGGGLLPISATVGAEADDGQLLRLVRELSRRGVVVADRDASSA